MNNKKQKGFTLVELIVVIAIVAILASVAIVGYTQFINNARETKAQSELDQIYNVMYADAVLGIKLDAAGEIVENGEVLELKAESGKIKLIAADDALTEAGANGEGGPADDGDALKAIKARYEIGEDEGFDGALTFSVTDLTMNYDLEVEVSREILFETP